MATNTSGARGKRSLKPAPKQKERQQSAAEREQQALKSLLTPGAGTVREAAARAGVSSRQVTRWLRTKRFREAIQHEVQERRESEQRLGFDSDTWKKVLASSGKASTELPKAAALLQSLDWTNPLRTFSVGFTLGRAHERGLKFPGANRGGHTRAEAKPAKTDERNKKMKTDYVVARTHDGMTMGEATTYLSTKNKLTVPQVCRAIKPRALERKMRAS